MHTDLLAAADAALYRAKRARRNRFETWNGPISRDPGSDLSLPS